MFQTSQRHISQSINQFICSAVNCRLTYTAWQQTTELNLQGSKRLINNKS